MIVSEIYSEIRNETNSNSTKLSDPYLLEGVNLDYGEVVMQILKVRTDYNFNAKEVYTDLISTSGLVAGDIGYNGEYPFPSDLIRPIRVEVSFYDGVYRPSSFYDVADNLYSSEAGNATNIYNYNNYPPYGVTTPFVRFERDSFFVKPLKTTSGNVAGGIHIWYEKRQAALTASDTPLFEPNFHRILVLRGALRVMRKFKKEYSQSDRNEVQAELSKLEVDMMSFYKDRLQKPLVARPSYLNMK